MIDGWCGQMQTNVIRRMAVVHKRAPTLSVVIGAAVKTDTRLRPTHTIAMVGSIHRRNAVK